MPVDPSSPSPAGSHAAPGSSMNAALSPPGFDSLGSGSPRKASSRGKQRYRHPAPNRSRSDRIIDHPSTQGEDDSGFEYLKTPTRIKDVNLRGDMSAVQTSAGSFNKRSNFRGAGPRSHDRTYSSPLVMSEDQSSAFSTPTRSAYAAPTFSASPAPSSLPIPKMLSRSVPDRVVAGGLQAKLKQESAQEPSLPPVPARDLSHLEDGPSSNDVSPLDIFFKADREEKARARLAAQASAAWGGVAPASSSSFSTPHGYLAHPHHARHLTNHSTPDMFSLEMDGERPRERPDYFHPGLPASHIPRMPVARSHTVPSVVAAASASAATTTTTTTTTTTPPATATPTVPGHEADSDHERRRKQSLALKTLLGIPH